MRQFITMLFCIFLLLFSCGRSTQNEIPSIQDSTYLNNLAIIKALGSVKRNYPLSLDKDTIVTEKEILIGKEHYNLKSIKYCLNDSSVAMELRQNDKRKPREFNITHDYAERVTLSKGKTIIFDLQFSKVPFKKQIDSDLYFRMMRLYDIKFNFEKSDKLHFTATLITADTGAINEVYFDIFYKDEKKGQLDFPRYMPRVSEMDIYDLMSYDTNSWDRKAIDEIGFISLSDKYPLSEHPDSLAIPDLSSVENVQSVVPDDESDEQFDEDKSVESKEPFNYEYFKLDSTYRDRFLTKMKFSESDNVFIYNYYNDKLISYPIKNLNVVACMNVYSQGDNRPGSQLSYMIGFEISKDILKSWGDEYYQTFVSVGKENPFLQGQVKPIAWKKANPTEFPKTEISTMNTLRLQDYKKGNVYTWPMKEFQFFIQEFINPRSQGVEIRHLVVIDSNTKEVVHNSVDFDTESASPSPLNFTNEAIKIPIQWAGKLFKNKPPVFFGFEWVSFGCPDITILDKPVRYIEISCDNRH